MQASSLHRQWQVRALHPVSALAVAPNLEWIAVGLQRGGVQIVNPSDGTAMTNLASARVIEPAARARFAGVESGSICRSEVTHLAFCPGGTFLAIAERTGGMRIWNLRQRTQVICDGRKSIHSMAWDPTGEYVAVGREGGIVTIFRGMALK